MKLGKTRFLADNGPRLHLDNRRVKSMDDYRDA